MPNFYGLHSTKKKERDLLLERDGKLIMISPSSFHYQQGVHKPMIWEEDTGRIYPHSPDSFLRLLNSLKADPNYNVRESQYMKDWHYKFHEVFPRVSRLTNLVADIRENGIENPVHCEITGERLDGAYRTKIALHLGIEAVPAILHRFHWTDIDEDFIERKLKIRWESSGKDYYEFEYGYKDWKNILKGGEVYRENAKDRWEVIKDLVKGNSVLDIGCNEGYMSLQLARMGKKVEGIDLDWKHVSYLNKLIYEFVDKKDLDCEFFKENALETTRNADTILLLNVLYHLPIARQQDFVRKFKGKRMIFQCNLRKSAERDKYYTSHPDDLSTLLDSLGIKYDKIEWRDKPFIVTKP